MAVPVGIDNHENKIRVCFYFDSLNQLQKKNRINQGKHTILSYSLKCGNIPYRAFVWNIAIS